jgi:D-serine deaminase-like pyridoxal phosphate-dependent protein
VLVYPDRIQANLQRMITMAGAAERLRPHVKTHKLPQIIQMKLAAGIRKFKASTIAEVEMTLAAGGRDILLAYQPVGPNVRRLAALMRRYPDARSCPRWSTIRPIWPRSAAPPWRRTSCCRCMSTSTSA